MISEEDYQKSLAKLETREKLSLLASENGKKFLEEYNNSLAIAKKENKNIFLFFHMNGCDGCNVVKYILDNNDNIKQVLSNYIVLHYNVTETKTNLVQKYNVYSYPACYLVNAEEKVIKQKMGIKVLDGPEKDLSAWLSIK